MVTEFVAWYEAWLDNVVRGGRPHAKWGHSLDAVFKVPVQTAEVSGVDELPKFGLEAVFHSPEGKPVDPCHGCESVYAHYGVPNTAFVMKK